MKDYTKLNGIRLYNSFLSGYDNLLKQKNYLNEINVFPVADGDTGSNMVSTFYSTIQAEKISDSLSQTLNSIADKALSGARGNSGIIVAQFINGLAYECSEKDVMTTFEFGSALRNAAKSTYNSLEDPKEGTLLTILRVWSEEMYILGQAIHNFNDLFIKSITSARTALKKTKEQLSVLKKAGVIDAGASGFVSFLEGIAGMISTGIVPAQKTVIQELHDEDEKTLHDIPVSDKEILFRYCTEALMLRESSDEITREKLNPYGDSLIISRGRNKTKIHIHTNNPSAVFLILKDYGAIIEQKVDDMLLQYNAVHNPLSETAIVTDSIADIPRELIDRYQIHVIPQKIIWGKNEYLDRITITGETFYPYLNSHQEYPTSSAPDPLRVEQTFEWLASHYRSIIAIPVAKVQSGTWQVMKNSISRLREKGYPATVIDSRLNSAAEGLAVISAAEHATAGMAYDEILRNLESTLEKARIYVSVATFKYMVRGGRVSALKGFIANVINLKPVITLNAEGRGTAHSTSFSRTASLKKILKNAAKNRDSISRYAVVHAGVPAQAEIFAEKLTEATGKKPEYIMEISPVVGIHAGIGALAVAWI
ncbi:MAG: DegV family EDD domain-containing protein [Spirochaetes bacterium]|nr:DegV family EDD domain-containing protein [Spirochaetota bacterium]